MKKFMRATLVLVLILTVAGIGFSMAGIALGATVEGVDFLQHLRSRVREGTITVVNHVSHDWDDDWDDWDDDWAAEAAAEKNGDGWTYDLGDVDELELSLRYDELILEPYSGDSVQVEIYNDPDQTVRVKSDSKSAEIKSSRKLKNRKVQVYYPQDILFRKLDIEVDAGTVTLGAVEAEELDVSVGAGEFTGFAGITAREADFSVGAGSITLEGLDADSIDGECGLGEMSMALLGKQTDWNYKLECGLGEISIGGESFSAFAGEKKIQNDNATKYLELECGMGSIQVDFE